MEDCDYCSGSGQKYLGDDCYANCFCIIETIEKWKMDFGEYKGKKFIDIPSSYLFGLKSSDFNIKKLLKDEDFIKAKKYTKIQEYIRDLKMYENDIFFH
tara:strand:- start:1336 stop:1632 length:297 start_codon:yes stop_codon:yes gene_type:complete